MSTKQSFTIAIRIIFTVSTIQFMREAFYNWDGHSYNMKFAVFLPEVSMAFLLWTVVTVIFAILCWLCLSCLLVISRIILKSLKFEHVIVWVLFLSVLLLLKRNFLTFSIYEFIGLHPIVTKIVVCIMVGVLVWIGRRYFEKIPQGLNTYIIPLVWLFTIMFILAIPFSFYQKTQSNNELVTIKEISQEAYKYQEKKRPNIIFIIMDALTAENMQVYGYERPTTPFIKKWAKDAIVFDRAYSSANYTTPSVLSIMLSKRLWTHRVFWMGKKIPTYENNFPKILTENGYDVSSFVQNQGAHPERLGISDAFSVRDSSETFWLQSEWWYDYVRKKLYIQNYPLVNEWIFHTSFLAKIILEYEPDIYMNRAPSEKVYNRFLDYVSRRSKLDEYDRPFFAYLHLWPPHNDYLPPNPYMGSFGDINKFISAEQQRMDTNKGAYAPELQNDISILEKRYDEFILYSDRQFEIFISRLAETVDMSNTIIILTSDHGESFSNGYFGHGGPHLYEQIVHVPLIISLPKKDISKKISTPVEGIDIAPTVVDLAGIPVPDWMEGQSLSPLLTDRPFTARPVFSMQFTKNKGIGNAPITKGTIAVWEGDYKLIKYLDSAGKTFLFNLKSDPYEKKNLFSKKNELSNKLIQIIDNNLDYANKKIMRSNK